MDHVVKPLYDLHSWQPSGLLLRGLRRLLTALPQRDELGSTLGLKISTSVYVLLGEVYQAEESIMICARLLSIFCRAKYMSCLDLLMLKDASS